PQLDLQYNIIGALLIVAFGFLFVTVSSRLTGEIGSSSNPISGMTVATLLLTCLIFLLIGWDTPAYYITALSIGGIVCIAASNGGTTSQDLKTGFLVGGTPRLQQIAILFGAGASALILGPILLSLNDAATVYVPRTTIEPITENVQQLQDSSLALPAYTGQGRISQPGNYRVLTFIEGEQPPAPGLQPGQYLVDERGSIVYRVHENWPADLRADTSNLAQADVEQLKGPQANTDTNSYRVWQRIKEDGYAQKFLVDDQGTPVYLVDPGINGTHRVTPDGVTVEKYRAPKATLMAYIINGILSRKLPWGLVLLGVMISIVLEMSGIPSLAFAVGVYLPLASSSPIFVGGMIRWLVDRSMRKRLKHKDMTEEELVAESDKSPGVLMASGYIAGGALASIVIAFMAGVLVDINKRLSDWSMANNPFYPPSEDFLKEHPGASPHLYADLLSLIPFFILIVLLYLVGRESILGGKKQKADA
ncbi:MAG TPA: OPT/YSL family transporter, partial [Blastocatellia bacterium]|nr:OPT/YSL family transporter [Blastocatellia bacterium]